MTDLYTVVCMQTNRVGIDHCKEIRRANLDRAGGRGCSVCPKRHTGQLVAWLPNKSQTPRALLA